MLFRSQFPANAAYPPTVAPPNAQFPPNATYPPNAAYPPRFYQQGPGYVPSAYPQMAPSIVPNMSPHDNMTPNVVTETISNAVITEQEMPTMTNITNVNNDNAGIIRPTSVFSARVNKINDEMKNIKEIINNNNISNNTTRIASTNPGTSIAQKISAASSNKPKYNKYGLPVNILGDGSGKVALPETTARLGRKFTRNIPISSNVNAD